MEHQLLEFLNSPFTTIKGVGAAISKNFSRLTNSNKIFHLLLHSPVEIEKIAILPRLFELKNNQLVTIKVKVESHLKPEKNDKPYKILCYTPTGYISLVFFKIFPSQISKLIIGKHFLVLGNFTNNFNENQIIHPKQIIPIDDEQNNNEILKRQSLENNLIYPLTAGISNIFINDKIKWLISKIKKDFNNIEGLEWHNKEILNQQKMPNFLQSIINLHNPNSQECLTNRSSNFYKSRTRLAFDELLAWQLGFLIARNYANKIIRNKNFNKKVLSIRQIEAINQDFLNSIPFKLTNSQLEICKIIAKNINTPQQMLRLLQGDVGSGKTIIAIYCCLINIARGQQCSIIAPTTILAKQHFEYFTRILSNLKFQNKESPIANYQKINLSLLTSATTNKQKQKIIDALINKEIDILISTHAVLEDNINFKDLGLAIIDEQHRFGVLQRMNLIKKGESVDCLLMSATPIPRSLMMGLYGDMDISILNEKPNNRKEIATIIRGKNKLEEVYQAILRAISREEKIYWICPAIEESNEKDGINEEKLESQKDQQKIELANIQQRYNELSFYFEASTISILHGKMKDSEKSRIMNQFSQEKSLQILVATTVIEVGIDIPQATLIIIENAENFGLAQLHQLRGRVGRNDKPSLCILLYGNRISERGRERLKILKESNDGFYIAEADLKIRGNGELAGTKQSGFPEFRIANLNYDHELLNFSNIEAKKILSNDPFLQKSENEKYQALLKLFNYQDFLNLVDCG